MMSTGGTTELMKNLKQLSKVDEQLARLTDRKVALEGKISSLEANLEARKLEIEDKLKEIKEEAHREHRNEILLKETEEELRKVKAQLNTAKTNEELRIFKKKRGELKNRISELEDAILTHLTGLDKTREEVETSKKLIVKHEEETQGKTKEIRAEIADCEQERNAESEKRSEIASQVPSEALNKYERVLAKEKHHPVVEVRDEVCQGCYMRVTSQEVNRVWRGEDLVLCRNCNRILCLPENEDGK